MSPSTQAQDANVNTAAPSDRRRKTPKGAEAKRDESPDTASRLQRKRLSDRRSQRAMREKTKQRIAELESALQALLATNVNRELKEKIAENQLLKEEVARLRARLEKIGRLCFAESEGATSNGLCRSQDHSTDDTTPKEKTSDQGMEVLSSSKRRRTSHSRTTTGIPGPQDNSPIPNSNSNSPEVPNGVEMAGYHNLEFNTAHDIDPLTVTQADGLAFGDEAFWSVIQSESNFDTFTSSTAESYSESQIYDDIRRNGLSMPDPSTLFNGRGSLDFADLRAPQSISAETPSTTSSSRIISTSNRNVTPPPSQPTIHVSPGLRSIWTFGSTPRRDRPGSLFEQMVQNALEKYKDLPKETLDTILPAVPCMAPFFSSTGCNSPLSKALFEQMREGSSWIEPASFLGAYWCLHSLLRYFLRPVVEEIPWIPSYMLPPTTPKDRPVTRWDFLPWPSVRERIRARDPVDEGGSSELEGYFGSQTTICWPYSLNEAITFAPPPDLVFGATGPYTVTGCSGCKCSAPQLTDRFKLHLTRAQHWRLKPGSPQILKKYPELNTVVL